MQAAKIRYITFSFLHEFMAAFFCGRVWPLSTICMMVGSNDEQVFPSAPHLLFRLLVCVASEGQQHHGELFLVYFAVLVEVASAQNGVLELVQILGVVIAFHQLQQVFQEALKLLVLDGSVLVAIVEDKHAFNIVLGDLAGALERASVEKILLDRQQTSHFAQLQFAVSVRIKNLQYRVGVLNDFVLANRNTARFLEQVAEKTLQFIGLNVAASVAIVIRPDLRERVVLVTVAFIS